MEIHSYCTGSSSSRRVAPVRTPCGSIIGLRGWQEGNSALLYVEKRNSFRGHGVGNGLKYRKGYLGGNMVFFCGPRLLREPASQRLQRTKSIDERLL